MKITKKIQAALLAIAGLAIIAPGIQASVTTYNDGDILLGFRQTGATQDYVIDIGQFSSLPGSGSTTFSLGNVAADLTTAFGSTWYTSNTVQFAAFGDSSAGFGKIFIGNSLNAAQSSALSGFLGNADQGISTAYGVYTNQTASVNAPTGLLQSVSSGASYASYQPGGANSGGINFGAWNNTESLVNANNYLDVYSLNASGNAPSGAPVSGYFSVNSSGNISYSVVPEPSTFMALALGTLILVTLRRRPRTV